jgi:SAM-dependent methyltransferase
MPRGKTVTTDEVSGDGDLFESERKAQATDVPAEPVTVEVVEPAEPELTEAERKTLLGRLRDDEKVIEDGLSTFIEVGWALMRIRDGKSYRALDGIDGEGYKTFEDYCQRRWDISRERGRQLINATDVTAALPTNVGIKPRREAQVRELMPLKDDPDALLAAWNKSVEEAGGIQPTARQVREVVDEYKVTTVPVGVSPGEVKHPAPFSMAVLRVIKELLDARFADQKSTKVLDPFAGTGRIHYLTEYGYDTAGVELEPEWAKLNDRTKVGDALKTGFRKGTFDAIATSPTYGNRLADSYEASDPDRRHSYHFDLGRAPSEGSSAVLAWGDEYRAFHAKAWIEALRVLKGNGRFILNIKDHIRDGAWQDVAAWHCDVILGLGFRLVAIRPVGTKGVPSGANANVRSEAELVIAFDRNGDAGD